MELVFNTESARPILIIETINCRDINNINQLDAIRINTITYNQSNDWLKKEVDFSKLPKSLMDLDSEGKLKANCLPPQIKRLGVYKIHQDQSWNMQLIAECIGIMNPSSCVRLTTNITVLI